MRLKKLNKNIFLYIIPLIVVIFNILIILSPNLVITSARNGLLLWFNNVLPSLLPFVIGTNLLIKLGFIDFLGTILENSMQKIFHTSGIGSFPVILGMFSGYPVGAKIVCDLRQNNKITKEEGNRLLTFTNNSGPLFILAAVGISMYNSPNIGYLMLAIHYISAITTGFVFRNYKYKKSTEIIEKTSVKKALKNLKSARLKENKTFGEILSDSVKNALEITTTVGGFIILFSVISSLFLEINIFKHLPDLANGTLIGIIEITNGCNILSTNKTAFSVILAISLISWSGFSIQAQTLSLISKTDLSSKLYIFSKVLHSLISFLYSIALSPLIEIFLDKSVETTFGVNSSQNFNLFIFSIKSILLITFTFIILNMLIKILSVFIKTNK